MVYIRDYKVSRSGHSNIIPIPPSFTKEMGLKLGDTLVCSRDGDKLVYVAEKKEKEKGNGE